MFPTYDVVIIGGAIMGSAAAWFLSCHERFDGRILVVERDPTYEFSSTAHTTSCIRQQFSSALNVKVSQFGAEFINNLRKFMGGDTRVPDLAIRSFGYLYLADNDEFAAQLGALQAMQCAEGAETRLLSAQDIQAEYPFYNVDDIKLGSINLKNEGYWDANAMFDWFKRQAQECGVEFLQNEVTNLELGDTKTSVEKVVLATGETILCGNVVNAAGPRASLVAKMAGIEIPVEPRKRISWIFKAERPLDVDLPLTIDPTGVHVRENGGGTYQAGGHSLPDIAVSVDDFSMDHALWEEKIWPTLAHRIPQFESIKVTHEWAGHYAFNTLDQNAILGPHTIVRNFHFINGFSGHGLQQAPAMGRGIAELLVHGQFRTLDLSPFGFDRIERNAPIHESAII